MPGIFFRHFTIAFLGLGHQFLAACGIVIRPGGSARHALRISLPAWK
jgi:hypothetical protein